MRNEYIKIWEILSIRYTMYTTNQIPPKGYSNIDAFKDSKGETLTSRIKKPQQRK